MRISILLLLYATGSRRVAYGDAEGRQSRRCFCVKVVFLAINVDNQCYMKWRKQPVSLWSMERMDRERKGTAAGAARAPMIPQPHHEPIWPYRKANERQR